MLSLIMVKTKQIRHIFCLKKIIYNESVFLTLVYKIRESILYFKWEKSFLDFFPLSSIFVVVCDQWKVMDCVQKADPKQQNLMPKQCVMNLENQFFFKKINHYFLV